MFKVRRSIDVVVLNCCVDRSKGRASGIEDLDDLGKIGERAGQPVDLVDDDNINPPRSDVGEQPLRSRPIHRGAGEPAIVISLGQGCPAFVRWLVM
jgi:hypothetical protein